MLKGQSEIRIIWLMVLLIVAVSAWFLNVKVVTYLCASAFVMSVMQYVDAIQKPIDELSTQVQLPIQTTSRVPLYIASITAVVGGVMHWSWLVGLGLTAWIYFFLRWLRRLEDHLNHVQYKLQHFKPSNLSEIQSTSNLSSESIQSQKTISNEIGLMDQLKQWLFQGNPVLKVAVLILVIGLILLLRFATEHWQLSLSLKLLIVAGISCVVTVLGYWFQNKNRSFALALEGLGIAGLCLTLFFAYYNQVITHLWIASLSFAVIMLITLGLSLKQQAVELALMAMLIAYLAPFTLPVRDATAVELVAYYLVINLAVAVLSTVRPWRILNQIAFIITSVVGGAYAFYHGVGSDKYLLSCFVLAHSLIFIWLSFRFSQLIAKQDFAQFKLKPVLDLALIFGAPIIGYIFIYLIYFKQATWQAIFSIGFAMLYALLHSFAQRNQSIQMISQSYFSLMLIFISLIPPILLPEQWSVVGWAIEGVLIFIYALYKDSAISRYLAMGLMTVAGLSSVYYWVVLPESSKLMYWILSLSYIAVVLISNSRASFQKQLTTATIGFFSLLMLSATSSLLILLLDFFNDFNQPNSIFLSSNRYVLTLLSISLAYVLMNEAMRVCKAKWSWQIPKWMGIVPLYILALILIIDRSEHGQIVWHSIFEQWAVTAIGLLLTMLWLRPKSDVNFEKEWVSLGVLLSLSMMSLSLIPNMPYISIVIIPLLFCAWCYWQKDRESDRDWNMFWQSKASLVLMGLWIICSQLYSQQAFQFYFFPILNPFDFISLAMLAGFIWMLFLQIKAGLDKGIIAILAVLSLLWLSSYMTLRALHVYFSTPYNELGVWQDATIQLSLTLLWVSLAFISMSLASRKQLRAMWILGGSILVIVTLKLVLFDLSHIGTLTRVISFLGAGFVMLIIAYIAPIPETEKV